MGKVRVVKFILLSFLAFYWVSCDESINYTEDTIQASSVNVEIEEKGGSAFITTQGSDWDISGVYSLNGYLLYDDSRPLVLNGLGTIEYQWFKIVRDDRKSLKVETRENFSKKEDRGCIIELRNTESSQRITIKQKASAGYTYDKIEYSLEEGDGDTTMSSSTGFTRLTFSNYGNKTSSVVIYPYQNTRETSLFVCSQEGAFDCLDEDSLVVEVPESINENKIHLGDSQRHYSVNIVRLPVDIDYSETVVAPPHKKVEVSGTIIYRKRVVTYTLSVVNKRTQEVRQFKGKWVQSIPVDCEIIRTVTDLPDEPELE